MENPLHHFELHPLIPLSLFGIDISINKAIVMMWIACGLVFLFFYVATQGRILAPAGTPGWLMPLMVPIELISQLARPVTLAVRLFANMTAGHIILIVLFSLMMTAPVYIGWMPFGFTVAIYGLELFVAFIQAYIFTILACVYLGDAVKLH